MSTQLSAVIIGNEILAGRREDKHLANTIAACLTRDLRLSQVFFLQDDAERLIQTYRRLREENQIVLSFGGIGATPDDRTRQAVAKACGVEIAYHPEGMAILKARFGAELTENRKQLVAFPEGAALIPNPVNQIPGFSINHIHCVPGFPAMAEPMIAWVLDQYYQNLAQKRVYLALQVDAPESEISPLMRQLEKTYPELSISSLPQIGHSLELGVEGVPEQVPQAIADAMRWLEQHTMAYQKME